MGKIHGVTMYHFGGHSKVKILRHKYKGQILFDSFYERVGASLESS